MSARNEVSLLRQLTSELDRVFDMPGWPALRMPRAVAEPTKARWYPTVDVFERDKRLVTKIDLPGMKKEDVKVEVADGHLTISGERRTDAEEKTGGYYRCEREYGTFYRAVPLPEGVKVEDVAATFADGVLEVSVPLPVQAEQKPRVVQIQDAPKASKSAA